MIVKSETVLGYQVNTLSADEERRFGELSEKRDALERKVRTAKEEARIARMKANRLERELKGVVHEWLKYAEVKFPNKPRP